ncbi:MAG: hypothetical protein ABNO52_00990 [Candidatus Shikimatogenerans sp. Tser]|uniref:Uncharacterized protein n=1 Tax=Candidatus Shikimatogenerans sp. Tser TaxID=3158568 RepID=A0AAU7QS78_9FLAO
MVYDKFNKKFKIFKKLKLLKKNKKKKYIFYSNYIFDFYLFKNKNNILNINIFFNKKNKKSILRHNIKNKIKHIIQKYFMFFLLIKKNIFIIIKKINNFKYFLYKKYILFFLKNYLK